MGRLGRRAVGILLVPGCAALSAPVSAHHSMVAFDHTKLTTVEGTVTTVKWRNPHFMIEVAVPTGDGKTETWDVEGGSVAAGGAAGISPKTVKVGTKVKVFGHRHYDPKVHMAILNGIEVDGKYYSRNAEARTSAAR